MFYYLHFCNSFCPVRTIQRDSSSLCFYQEANLEEEDMHGSSVLLLNSFPPQLYKTCLMVCITHVLVAGWGGRCRNKRGQVTPGTQMEPSTLDGTWNPMPTQLNAYQNSYRHFLHFVAKFSRHTYKGQSQEAR